MGWQVENATVLIAGNTIINPNGAFTYSAAPAAGNLLSSIAPAAGVDSFGNHYLQGTASYFSTFASQLNGSGVAFFFGSLSGGWTQVAAITFTSGGTIFANSTPIG